MTEREISDCRGAPKIGGNHVLKSLLETGLYQRTRMCPGAAG